MEEVENRDAIKFDKTAARNGKMFLDWVRASNYTWMLFLQHEKDIWRENLSWQSQNCHLVILVMKKKREKLHEHKQIYLTY